MKYLLLFALLGAVWWIWSKRKAADEAHSRPQAKDPEKMVNCAQCGVYLPESDSIAEGGRAYCCEAHRAAGPAAGR